MIERYLRLLFWLAVAVCFVMAIIPKPVDLGMPSDKWQHMAAFATLTALAIAAYRPLSAWRVLLGLAAFGALIEVVQGLDFIGRDADLKDLAADILAVLAILAIAGVGQAFVRKSWLRI